MRNQDRTAGAGAAGPGLMPRGAKAASPPQPGAGGSEPSQGSELDRLEQDEHRARNWKRFGPYLAERQWGTVREDYSENGDCWNYLPHDHARSRAYRWGEDGLLGISDDQSRICFALALWNGADPILKERLFGLTGPEGNHGEDVKEHYFYLDSTPTHSYMRALYKYPQREFPYGWLVDENRRRGKHEPEFELADTGAFDDGRYFDVTAEYAKASPDDIVIAITVANRGPVAEPIAVLPTLWFRNTWAWGRSGEGYSERPTLAARGGVDIDVRHATLGNYRFAVDVDPTNGARPELLFTENDSNSERLFGAANATPYVKDAFHAYVVIGRVDRVNPERHGTKAAALYRLVVPAGGEVRLRMRLTAVGELRADGSPFADFEAVLAARRAEGEAFYAAKTGPLSPDERLAVRQAYAGL